MSKRDYYEILGVAKDASEDEIRREDWELAAVRTREGIRALGTVTGENASPDVLDEIFSRFCIGK